MNSQTTLRRPARFLPLLAVTVLCGCGGAEVSAADGGTAAPAGATGSAAMTSAAAAGAPSGGAATSPSESAPMATDPAPPTDTQVVLSYVSWDADRAAVIAGGHVSPVVEDGGTCTLELTRAGETVQASTEGRAGASTTDCGGLSVPGDQLAPGSWTAVLTYGSAAVEGRSDELTVEVAG